MNDLQQVFLGYHEGMSRMPFRYDVGKGYETGRQMAAEFNMLGNNVPWDSISYIPIEIDNYLTHYEYGEQMPLKVAAEFYPEYFWKGSEGYV
jgi:hypothetical protein